MGEMLKFQNIKNGKRKIPMWVKLSHKMLQIMNDSTMQMEYETRFERHVIFKQAVRRRNQTLPTDTTKIEANNSNHNTNITTKLDQHKTNSITNQETNK